MRSRDDTAADCSRGDRRIEKSNAAITKFERHGANDKERDGGLDKQRETQADEHIHAEILTTQEPGVAPDARL